MAKGYHPLRRRSSDPIPERNSSETNNNSFSLPTRISMNSLRRGLTLPLNNMAIPIYASPPSREDVEVGGRVLFQHFISEELLHEGIPEEILDVGNPPPDAFGDIGPEMVHDENVGSRAQSPAFSNSMPDGYKNSHFIQLGANIRNIADTFAKSHERNLIREQADEVDLSHINYFTFYNMLNELFRDGYNGSRIVSLFFFCSDVLIRCIRNELHRLGSKLFFWALQFLCNKVCDWVRNNGGWERVFANVYNVLYSVLILSTLTVVSVTGFFWLKKNI